MISIYGIINYKLKEVNHVPKSVERFLTEDKHLTIPDDKIAIEWFKNHGIPVYFKCAKCRTRTFIFDGAVNKKEELLCRKCAKMK